MKRVIIAILILVGLFYLYQNSVRPKNNVLTTGSRETVQTSTKMEGVIAGNLQIPWSLVFLPDESILFTERVGRVRHISPSGVLTEAPLAVIKEVNPIGEGGLLGIELHPQFTENNYIYLYYTYSGSGDSTLNKVVRYRYKNNKLSEDKTIISEIPGNRNHNGGRLKFGPDGYLYIATGDSQQPSLSQDTGSLAGKILRVTDEGNPANGNPFNNRTYSYGHRNPQGLVWDDKGQLWSTEHGPSAKDELNKIRIGENYGWPDVTGDQVVSGVVSPVINSHNDTWAPSGLAYLSPNLYFAGLRGNALYKFDTTVPITEALSRHFLGEYGRLRDVVLGPDGYLYVTTSNMDGRSLTHLNGDKIIRLDPKNIK